MPVFPADWRCLCPLEVGRLEFFASPFVSINEIMSIIWRSNKKEKRRKEGMRTVSKAAILGNQWRLRWGDGGMGKRGPSRDGMKTRESRRRRRRAWNPTAREPHQMLLSIMKEGTMIYDGMPAHCQTHFVGNRRGKEWDVGGKDEER